ncbi:hypothetical protein GWI33_023198 [Rhynchophorus ferrugineus]|uniref:Uncharacterized protein n=1 Tax=Rhynchophorus ferrugineus TaxID=354439 RepID=A0A834HLN1_RHYFE|nr:hypothetical protein GWI33_023198 [Rhynchophorus ferrugineus]
MNCTKVLSEVMDYYNNFVSKFPSTSEKCRRETVESLLKTYKSQLTGMEYSSIVHQMEELVTEVCNPQKKTRLSNEIPKENQKQAYLPSDGEAIKYPNRRRAIACRRLQQPNIFAHCQQINSSEMCTTSGPLNTNETRQAMNGFNTFSERMVYCEISENRIVLKINKKALV